MDSGQLHHTRPTATAVVVPDVTVPTPRSATPVESGTIDTPIAPAPAGTGSADTAPIPVVAGTAPAVDPMVDTGPIATVPAGVAPTVTPPATTPVASPCRCGHGRDAHEHFRRGTDCAGCDCARFRRPSLLARLRG